MACESNLEGYLQKITQSARNCSAIAEHQGIFDSDTYEKYLDDNYIINNNEDHDNTEDTNYLAEYFKKTSKSSKNK